MDMWTDSLRRLFPQLVKPLSTGALAAALTVGLAPSAPASPNADILAACAAFSQEGRSAAVTVDITKVSVDLNDPVGKVSHLSLALRNAPLNDQPTRMQHYSCDVYFSRGWGLIAIGVSSGFPASRLQIGVADADHLEWTGDWMVEPASGISELSLLGFLEGTTSVVVGGEPSTPTKYGPGIRHGSFWSLLFNPKGQQVGSMPTTRDYGSSSDLFPHYADASHNRLWVFRCVVVSAPGPRQPDCPIDWTTLVGDSSSSPEFDPRKRSEKRTDFWTLPGTFAAPDGNTIVVAQGDTVWLVDLQEQTVERLVVPKRFHFPQSEEIYGAAAISPDEKIVALPLVKESLAFPYLVDNYVYKGTNFAVVQLHPFQLLGILPGAGPKSWAACAIDDRGGHVIALIFHEDHWERTELTRSPHS